MSASSMYHSSISLKPISVGQVREDLKRLAKLAADVSDAHTCAIFLPTGLLISDNNTSSLDINSPLEIDATDRHSQDGQKSGNQSIEMVAAHSASHLLVRDCRIQVGSRAQGGSGLLGWVAENRRPIHMAPFDIDSTTLGIYSDHEQLKSLVAVPIAMPVDAHGTKGSADLLRSGVLMCDTRRAFTFSKAQLKHIEDIAVLVSRLIFWTLFRRDSTPTESSWDSFVTKSSQLGDAIGYGSVSLLRITTTSLPELESRCGISQTVSTSEQFMRLVAQAIPPHFPLVRLPNGDLLVTLDNMMTTFFENKIKAISKSLNDQITPFEINIANIPAEGRHFHGFDIDAMMRTPASPSTVTTAKVVGGPRA